MSRVLVVEDEAHLAQGLCFNLQAEGYSAEVVGDELVVHTMTEHGSYNVHLNVKIPKDVLLQLLENAGWVPHILTPEEVERVLAARFRPRGTK